jgi:hypothetical protein
VPAGKELFEELHFDGLVRSPSAKSAALDLICLDATVFGPNQIEADVPHTHLGAQQLPARPAKPAEESCRSRQASRAQGSPTGRLATNPMCSCDRQDLGTAWIAPVSNSDLSNEFVRRIALLRGVISLRHSVLAIENSGRDS